jgi:Ca2+-binding EF-hand superfamily protein
VNKCADTPCLYACDQFEGQGIEEELLNLMKAADVDGDGTIDYAEFLAATVQLSTLQSDENLEKV